MNNALAEMEKWEELARLNAGDKIKIRNGRDIVDAVFLKLNRTKFVASFNGLQYNCPIMGFVEVTEKIDQDALKNAKLAEMRTLKVGEPFYIEKGGDAFLYYFDRLEGAKIYGKHPISGGNVRIDPSLYGGKVSK